MDRTTLQTAQAFVRFDNESVTDTDSLHLEKVWNEGLCRTRLTNQGCHAVRVQEVVLFSGPLTLAPTTAFYGEGFQMLSQTAGTLDSPLDLSKYTDRAHYRIPQVDGMLTAYNLVLLSEVPTSHFLMAFTSCRRFAGIFRFGKDHFEVVLDTENMVLAPQETWELEEFFCATGTERDTLFSNLAGQIERNHPRLRTAAIPTGWCSWYYYGPRISEQAILDNMQAISRDQLKLSYIQIDDGYARALGDWLEPGALFPGGMKALCHTIHERGFEPAIWVSPFIAEASAHIVQQHPEWFVQDEQGEPLLSNVFSFGGWRNGPWYMLDGTHPGAQAYIEHVFRTMRDEWGCRYFKLDALMWGALHSGHRYDASATRVEAYRQGMEAVRRGAGDDSFILGCNAPLWPSLGVVHGMRVTGDIARDWNVMASVAHQYFWRGWQHNRLWINDPDCMVLSNGGSSFVEQSDVTTMAVTNDEVLAHATAIYASGGMVLSGDRIVDLPEDAKALLRKLLPPTGIAAQFDDTTYSIGRIDLTDRQVLCLFNWSTEPCELVAPLPRACSISDYWTDEIIEYCSGTISLQMRPHSARLLVCKPHIEGHSK